MNTYNVWWYEETDADKKPRELRVASESIFEAKRSVQERLRKAGWKATAIAAFLVPSLTQEEYKDFIS